VVKRALCEEITKLSQEANGLHFKASKATSEYLEGSFIQSTAIKMKMTAPSLWDLVLALLNANPSRRRLIKENSTKKDMPLDQERDLGEFGGDETRESEGESGDTD
jgi:hypothetical protein